MKKIISKILILAMCALLVLSMAACGGDTKDTEPAKTETGQDAGDSAQGNSSDVPEATGAVEQSAPVDASYFNDAAFVGDSVSLKLCYYADNGCLGDAQFFTSGSLGANNALWEVSDESVHPEYQGEKMLIEDCIQKSGAKKIYMMLGMNDLGLYGIETTLESYQTLIGKILEKSPDAYIIVQSMTPMTDTSTILGNSLNNENIKLYNDSLEQMCADNGWAFIDVASVMYNEAGTSLNPDYCSDPVDMGVHFTETGCQAWVDYLLTHTP